MVVASDPDAIYDVVIRRFEAAYLALPRLMDSIIFVYEISHLLDIETWTPGKSHPRL